MPPKKVTPKKKLSPEQEVAKIKVSWQKVAADFDRKGPTGAYIEGREASDELLDRYLDLTQQMGEMAVLEHLETGKGAE